MKDLTETINKIQIDITTSLKAEAKILSHTSNWASILPSLCLRQQVYYRLDWDKQSLPAPRLQGIFNTGNLVEDMTIVNLNQIGIRANPKWELLKLPDKINDRVLAEHQIGSVTDVFLIVHNGNGKPENLGPVEIKSVDPNIYRNINNIDDFQKHWWMKRYTGQLTTYMFGSNFEQGIFLLVNKTNWWDYKWLPYYLDVGYMDMLLAKAKIVNNHVKNRTYPDRCEDRSECEFCSFKAICLPDEESAQIEITDNAELLELLEQRESVKEQTKEFEEINEKLHTIWKQTKAGTYLVGGKFQVKITTYLKASYDLPDEIKSHYKESVETKRTIITKLKE